jgi:hypothetical protein
MSRFLNFPWEFPDFVPDTYRTRKPYLSKPFFRGLSATVLLPLGVKRNSIFYVAFIDTAFFLRQVVWGTGTRKPFPTFGPRGRGAPGRGRDS